MQDNAKLSISRAILRGSLYVKYAYIRVSTVNNWQ